ncbi:MAG: CPBP family intramembrane metalloprotease [Planctomycetaceae bacterium]|jgi:membrane protease YdiL (CAAX protease family)|nr:CPBP family intramembrane metalloprotease [Planctomycetaceae bacterium]
MKEKVILLYVLFSSVVWKSLFNGGVTEFSGDWFWYDFLAGEGKLISAFILFGVVPMLIVKFVFCEKLSDYGVRIGEVIRTLRSFCIAFPLVILIAIISGNSGLFNDVYPFNVGLRRCNLSGGLSYKLFLVHAVLYAGYYWGWEFMFRGFMQHGLSTKCGIGVAILAQTIPSVMLHFGHPTGEVVGSICAGLAWGYLAYRSRSLLSGFAQHTTLGIVLDWKLIYG